MADLFNDVDVENLATLRVRVDTQDNATRLTHRRHDAVEFRVGQEFEVNDFSDPLPFIAHRV